MPGVGLLDGGDRAGDRRRIVDELALLLEARADELDDALHVLRRPTGGALLGGGHDPVAEVADQLREPAGGVERPVLASHRHGAQLARDGDHRDAHTGPLQVTPVEVEDPLPRRVEVDLGLGEQDGRAQLDRSAQELDLRRRQLARRVRDQDQAVGERQEGEGRRGVPGAQPAHAGRVDDDEPLGQDRAGHGDLDALDALVVAGVARLGHPVAELGEGDRTARRVLARAPDDGGGLLAVAHERDRRGRQVVVDRADGLTEQSVDQRALALLELADDGDDRRRTLQPGGGRGDATDQVRPLELVQEPHQLERSVAHGIDRRGG